METTVKKIKRTFEGKVVSNKADKTVVVSVSRTILHPKYSKRYVSSKKYQVHDPKNSCKVGEMVTFEECRPISRHKRWRVVYAQEKKG